MRKIAWAFGLVLAGYLIVRAAIEPFTIGITDPAAYENDWGGPSLAGVLLVHMAPGIVALVLIVLALARRRSLVRRVPRLDRAAPADRVVPVDRASVPPAVR